MAQVLQPAVTGDAAQDSWAFEVTNEIERLGNVEGGGVATGTTLPATAEEGDGFILIAAGIVDTGFVVNGFSGVSLRVNNGWDATANAPVSNLGFASGDTIQFTNTLGEISGTTTPGSPNFVTSNFRAQGTTGNAANNLLFNITPPLANFSPQLDVGSSISLVGDNPGYYYYINGTWTASAGTGGPAGPQGDTGDTGPTGPTGPRGQDYTLLQGSATTVPTVAQFNGAEVVYVYI